MKETADELLELFTIWYENQDFYRGNFSFELYKEIGFHAFDGILLQYQLNSKKCERMIPIEVKADTDVFDKRLPRQIATQIHWFGDANLILGSKFRKNEDEILKWIPANIYRKKEFVKEFELIHTLEFTEGNMLSQRATNHFSIEIHFIKKIYDKCLYNRVAWKKEIPFTPHEKFILKTIRNYNPINTAPEPFESE